MKQLLFCILPLIGKFWPNNDTFLPDFGGFYQKVGRFLQTSGTLLLVEFFFIKINMDAK